VDAVKASAASTSFFELFHIEPSVDPELPLLEATYYELSLKLHPDCNTGADLKTRLHALEQTTQLNEAYATLLSPERRAFYLLKICGVDLDDKHSALPFTAQPPPAFLSYVLELREELHKAFSQRQADTLQNLERLAKEALQKELEEACRHLRSCLLHRAELSRLQPQGGEAKASPSPATGAKELQQAAAHLLCVRYWQRFLKDAELFQEELFS